VFSFFISFFCATKHIFLPLNTFSAKKHTKGLFCKITRINNNQSLYESNDVEALATLVAFAFNSFKDKR